MYTYREKRETNTHLVISEHVTLTFCCSLARHFDVILDAYGETRCCVLCLYVLCCADLQSLSCVCMCVCVQLTVLWATSANTEEKYLGGLDWDDRGAIAYVT